MEREKFFDILNRELEITQGCTEPAAIAYAAALARKNLKGDKISHIKVYASKNVIKNAMGVTIPGTESCGIPLAAALGAIAGNADKKLEVLANLNNDHLKKAKKMINQGKITFDLSNSPKKLYIEVIIENKLSKSKVIIEDDHTNVVLIELDGKTLEKYSNSLKIEKNKSFDFLNLDSIYEFIENIETKELDIINRSIEINQKICIEGLNSSYSRRIKETIKSNISDETLSVDTVSYAVALTAAGSCARMSGSTLPVISNSGSGNQGISATIPVVAVAEKLNINFDEVLRAVTLSHLITIYIKSKFGRLSALCGATVSATGASCGIAYLLGGKKDEIWASIQNMLGNVTGMICDGAKSGCALKVATCTSAALQSACMAVQGICIKSTDGIIEDDPEKTIENFCRLANSGMDAADDIILDIMLKKSFN
jgi:L-cysteine desulfidase